ncbi:IclR family transcriptional regulator [uncultured Tateyamaria sp.]|uniref:IclR family transcriptional regulator n=1 Tax=uncultured Tateyamaria sp. TaxID=455651 RepID=UPI0026197FBB|nr:IclR family transcriptional regulator [uncultured Tateyamaria sp.]
MEDNQRIQGIQVITRAADILRVLGRNTDGLSLGQIAAQVSLPRSTVQRIVSALSHERFVATDGGQGRIRLGPEIQSLAQAPVFDMRERLRPVMKEISAATSETVDLAILEGRQMRFVDQVVGSQRLRTVSSIGETFPLTTTANGKAALACLEEVVAEKLILAELAARPEFDIKLGPLLAELSRIRGGDLARDENEHTDGISALGFAVMGQNGDIFAISVPAPSSRFVMVEAELRACMISARDEFLNA